MAPFPGEDEQQAFYRAGKLFDDGDYAEAARLWHEMLQLYPFEAMLYFVLGRCKHMQRLYDEALVFYTAATKLNEEFWQAYYCASWYGILDCQ